MHQYLQALQDVVDHGRSRPDRTGTGTRNVFGRQWRFNLSAGFPVLTTKKLHLRSIIHELLWFIAGDTNVRYLQENKVRIWNEWADENGDLGPVYGKQWRSWPNYRDGGEIDQLKNVVEGLRKDPYGRRHMVVAWNPADVAHMALPPCHCMFQFFAEDALHHERVDWWYRQDPANRGTDSEYHRVMRPGQAGFEEWVAKLDRDGVPKLRLSCQLYQRSADIFLGVPFNVASYALLTEMVARDVGMIAGDYVHTFGDLHLYDNHIEQAYEQLSRSPGALPKLKLNPEVKSIFDFKFEDISIVDYDALPSIKADVAV